MRAPAGGVGVRHRPPQVKKDAPHDADDVPDGARPRNGALRREAWVVQQRACDARRGGVNGAERGREAAAQQGVAQDATDVDPQALARSVEHGLIVPVQAQAEQAGGGYEQGGDHIAAHWADGPVDALNQVQTCQRA